MANGCVRSRTGRFYVTMVTRPVRHWKKQNRNQTVTKAKRNVSLFAIRCPAPGSAYPRSEGGQVMAGDHVNPGVSKGPGRLPHGFPVVPHPCTVFPAAVTAPLMASRTALRAFSRSRGITTLPAAGNSVSVDSGRISGPHGVYVCMTVDASEYVTGPGGPHGGDHHGHVLRRPYERSGPDPAPFAPTVDQDAIATTAQIPEPVPGEASPCLWQQLPGSWLWRPWSGPGSPPQSLS